MTMYFSQCPQSLSLRMYHFFYISWKKIHISLFMEGIARNRKSVWPAVGLPMETTWFLSYVLPSIPTAASIYLLIIPLIWESFSTCCCCSLLSLSSSRFWYCRRILLVCCSCVRSLRSYSSSFLWDISRRSFRELISSSYSRTWWQTHGAGNAK